MGLWTGVRCHKFLRQQITFELASRSSNCCLLFNFSSASFIRQLSWWYKSVVKEDCNFSNFGTEAFLVSCYLGHRFCTRCLTGEIHSTGDDKNQMILALFRRWSSKSAKSSTERLIIDSRQGACLNVGYKAAKKKKQTKTKTLAKITFPWPSVRCLYPIASCSVSVG